MKRIAVLLLLTHAAHADSTVAGTTRAEVRALFAIQGTAAIPLVCWDAVAKQPIDRFHCRDHIPTGASVRFDNQAVATITGPVGVSCGGEVDPFPALRLANTPRGAIYAVYPSSLTVPTQIPSSSSRNGAVFHLTRHFGDSATDEIHALVRGKQILLEWRDGDQRQPIAAITTTSLKVLEVPNLDDGMSTELLAHLRSAACGLSA